jgi:hypothetical protein
VKTIREPARDIPVLAEADVVVCGGGPAGCAAAIAAARHGARTLLVEKDGYLGGATVSQLVSVILSSNGVDFQGVWHEYARALRERGGLLGPFGKTHEWWGSVDPEQVKHVWDALVDESGVELLHHGRVSEAILEPVPEPSAPRRITGVIVETRAGRRAVVAKRVIDATGDGVVCARAGVPWEQGDGVHPWAMACTMVFRMGNVRWPDHHPDPAAIDEFAARLRAAVERGEYDSPGVPEMNRLVNYLRHKAWQPPERRTGEYLSVMSRVLQVDPLDPFDFTRATREGREQARQCADVYRRFAPGFEKAYLLDTGSQIGLRSSRRIRGLATVTTEDVVTLNRYADGVARGSFSVDVWPADSYNKPAGCAGSTDAFERFGTTRAERDARLAAGECYDIRYGALVASGIDNLLVAGRCVSSEHHAQSSLRIQQTCMATGQAAGVAAALSLSGDVTPRELDTKRLVQQLEEARDVEPALDACRELPGPEGA